MKYKSHLFKPVAAACFSLFAVLASSTAHATLVGPAYPAPGGNTFVSNGVAFKDSYAQPRIGTYSGFNSAAYGQLYFGSSDNNAFCISLNGTTCSANEYLHPDANFVNDNTLRGTASFLNGFTGQTQQADTMLTITLYDSANNVIPWVLGTSLGLSTTDFVADVTAAAAGGGFYYKATMAVCVQGGGCDSPAQEYAAYHMDSGGTLFTSASTAFFSTPAEATVPEPASLALIAFGLAGLAIGKRRKNG